jgi:hypothetical protein
MRMVTLEPSQLGWSEEKGGSVACDAMNIAAELTIDRKPLSQGPQVGIGTGIEFSSVLVQEDNALPLAGGTDCGYAGRRHAGSLDGLVDDLTDCAPEVLRVELPAERRDLRRRVIGPVSMGRRNDSAPEIEDEGSTAAGPGIYGQDAIVGHPISTLED